MANLHEYKCPCCGGGIEFDSSLQLLKCPYCDTEFDPETLKGYDDCLNATEADDNLEWKRDTANEWIEGESEGLRIYICKSCGGEIIGDDNMAATSCPYCGNPVVIMEQFSGVLKPDYVIPFKLDKKAAKAKFMEHLSNKRLLPKVFKDENHIDDIKGIYVPFWLFDADADANFNFRGTTVNSWSDKNYIYTETSYYSLLRSGVIGFDHIPVDGSAKMPDDLMESIEPFNFKEAVDFQTAYLAGYLADKYDVNSDVTITRANARVKSSTEQAFARTTQGYSSVRVESSNVNIGNGSTKYALYPVWILNTTWRGEKYLFAMNGQTGKFVGNLPLDKSAYRKWLWGLTGAITAASFLISYLIFLLG